MSRQGRDRSGRGSGHGGGGGGQCTFCWVLFELGFAMAVLVLKQQSALTGSVAALYARKKFNNELGEERSESHDWDNK